MLITPAVIFGPGISKFPISMKILLCDDSLCPDDDLRGVDLLVVPLFGVKFDACEMIAALGPTGFKGHIRVVAGCLPDREMVLAELRVLADRLGLDIELSDCL